MIFNEGRKRERERERERERDEGGSSVLRKLTYLIHVIKDCLVNLTSHTHI